MTSSLPTTKPPINEPSTTEPINPEIKNDLTGLDELRALESKFKNAKMNDPSKSVDPNVTPKQKRKRKIVGENLVRMTWGNWWKFLTWMKSRGWNLTAEQINAIVDPSLLVEPLVNPTLDCMDAYLPEKFIDNLEEKAPFVLLLFAVFETSSNFSARMDQAARELGIKTRKQKQEPQPEPQQEKPRESVYPNLNERGQ